jgi:DNA primase
VSLAPAFLDDLRARTGLTAIIGRKVKLTRAGREMKGCCPFHNEKTPSFYVNEDKGFYHCFGCGAHGDAIRFLTELDGLSFIDAVKTLAAEAGLELPPLDRADPESRKRAGLHDILAAAADWYREQLRSVAGAAAREYLSGRQVSSILADQFGLGFAPDSRDALTKGLEARIDALEPGQLMDAGLVGEADGRRYDRFRGRLMFPIHDPRGRVVGFGGRILGDGNPKYLNSPEGPVFDKGRLLYNFHRAGPAARKSGNLFVVEGYMDVVALAKTGIPEAVAPLGTALTEDQIALCWKACDNPTLSFDGDEAGRRAAAKAALRILPHLVPGKGAMVLTLPLGLDPDDFVKQQGAKAFRDAAAQAKILSQFLYNHLERQANLTTPEGRIQFSATLREVSSTIANFEIQKAFLSEWRRSAWQAFRLAQESGRFQDRDSRSRSDLKSEVADLLTPNRIVEAKILASIARRDDPNEIEHYVEEMIGVEFFYPALNEAFFELRDKGEAKAIRLRGVIELLPREVAAGDFRRVMKGILSAVIELGHQRRAWKDVRAQYDSHPEKAYSEQRSLAAQAHRTRERLLALAAEVADVRAISKAAA